MDYIKEDGQIYKITETKELVDLAALRAELVARQTANRQIEELMAWVASLPTDKQAAVIVTPLFETEHLAAEIATLEAL